MQELSFLLKKYQNLGLKEKRTTEIIQEVFEKEIKTKIPKEQIKILGEKLRIKTSGPIKSEILIKKNKIQRLINQKLEEEGYAAKKIIQN